MNVKKAEPGTDTSFGDELVESLTEGLAILRRRVLDIEERLLRRGD